MYKKSNLLSILVVGGLLTLTGCVGVQGDSKKVTVGNKATIGKIDFTLPQQIKWKQIKNQKKNGNLLAEWIPVTNKDHNSAPVRVIYQRLVSNQPVNKFLSAMTQPLQKACTNIKANPFKTTSTYKNQANVEVFCAQLGQSGFGTASYLSVFSDGVASYMLVSEVKLPPSKKAGVVRPKNNKEKQWASTSATLAKFMRQMNSNIRFCSTPKKCQ